MPSLRIERPNRSPLIYRLQSPLTSIGQARYAQVTLADPLVPEIALQIRFEEQSYFASVFDPDHYPVFINGKPTRRHRLLHKDRLRVGSTEMVFWDEDESARRPRLTQIDADKIFDQLVAFSGRISQDTRVDELLEALMDGALTITGADKGFLALFDGEEAQIRVARNCRRESLGDIVGQMSDSILATVRRTRQPLVIEDVLRNPEHQVAASIQRLGLTSVMCLPLLEREHLMGLLYLGRHFMMDLLDSRSLAPLTVLATQGALLIRNALLIHELQLNTKRFTEGIEPMGLGEVIGACPAMQDILRQVARVATTEAPVLLLGEEGTGKEFLAREIHRRSLRAERPFTRLHCGTVTERRLGEELFAAETDRSDRLAGGTLYLDEIDALPSALQACLAQALEDRAIIRQGSHAPVPLDVRIIASSCRDLSIETATGRFREDLFRQLDVVRITLPPLRERGEDLLLLAKFFLDRHGRELNSLARGFAPDAVQVMRRYPWPGNIRQLEHHIRRAATLARGPMLGATELAISAAEIPPLLSLDEAREQFEREYIQYVLTLCQGSRRKAARVLGMDRRTLYRHLGEREQEGVDGEPGDPAA